MQVLCHKCGEELQPGSGESPFCPHCGTPQLYLALENQSVETGGDPEPNPDGSQSTGQLPPPLPHQVDWKTAIRCAVLVAGVGSVLTLVAMRVDVVSPVSLLWIMSASLITLALYQKQRPTAWIDARVGARIGMVVGLCLAVGLGTVVAGWGVVARFGLHAMGNFDMELTAKIAEGQKLSAQFMSTPTPPELARLEQTPEFHATYVLLDFAMATLMLVALSTLGGAFAGLLRTRRGKIA